MSYETTRTALDDRCDRYRMLKGEITLLSMLAIAQKAAAVRPDAAYLALSDSDQEGGGQVSAGFYTAAGEELPGPDGDAEDALWSLCDNLGDDVRAVWEPFTAQVAGRTCLDLSAALRISGGDAS